MKAGVVCPKREGHAHNFWVVGVYGRLRMLPGRELFTAGAVPPGSSLSLVSRFSHVGNFPSVACTHFLQIDRELSDCKEVVPGQLRAAQWCSLDLLSPTSPAHVHLTLLLERRFGARRG